MRSTLLVERGTEPAPGPQQADAERRRIEAERPARLRRRQVFPGDEQECLAVGGAERAQCPVELRVELGQLRRRDGRLGRARSDRSARGAPLGEQQVASGRVEPWQRVVARHVGEPPPGDAHRLGRDLVRIPRATSPRVGRDRAEMREDLSEALLGGTAIGIGCHDRICRKWP